MDATLV